MSAGGKTERAFGEQKSVLQKMGRNRTEIKQRQGSYELKDCSCLFFIAFGHDVQKRKGAKWNHYEM